SSNDSLADDLVSGTNDSDINNLVSRQPQPQAINARAGLRMWVLKSIHGSSPKQCTFGFAVRKVSGRNQFNHGFLTLGSCMHGTLLGAPYNQNPVYYTPNQNWVRQQAIYLAAIANLKYDPANGDGVSDDMIVNNGGELEMVAVSNQPYPQAGLTANQELLVVPLIVLGQEIPLELQWSPKDTFQNLIKV
ncbi:6320_t:CDS:2, partial [Funneliformis geosporum]